MQRLKQAFLAAAIASLVPVAALANPANGFVQCGDSGVGVANVLVTIGYWGFPDYSTYTGYTDSNGNFAIVTPDDLRNVTGGSVVLEFNGYTSPMYGPFFGTEWGTFSIPADFCSVPPPPPPPPPPACTIDNLGSTNPFEICPARPFGSPTKECGYFGLAPIGSDSISGGNAVAASMSATLALVKAGTCYNIYVGVTAGQTLSSPNGQGISHVTYCGCP